MDYSGDMAELRKDLVDESIGFIKSIKVRPNVKADLPDTSSLEEKLRRIYGPKQRQAQSEPVQASTASHPSLPTREETVAELKRRLTKELYKAELDLAGGLRIGGKPCMCLERKHTLMLEAAAEELISEEPDNPVYREIIQWIRNNENKLTVEAIASGAYDNEYPQMAAKFRDFRKRVAGTVAIEATKPTKAISLEEAKKLAAEEAAKEVEKRWVSQQRK
jgi:hypothetical protein